MNFASLKATLQDQFPDYRIIGAVYDDTRGIVVVPVREAHPDPIAFRGLDVELDPLDLPDLQEAAVVQYAAQKVGAVLTAPLPVKSGSGYRTVRAS